MAPRDKMLLCRPSAPPPPSVTHPGLSVNRPGPSRSGDVVLKQSGMSTWSRSHSGFVVTGERDAAAHRQLRAFGFGSIFTLTVFCSLNHKKKPKKDNYLPVNKPVTNDLRSRVME